MRPLFTSMLFHAPLAPADMRQRVTGPHAKELFAHAELDLFPRRWTATSRTIASARCSSC